MATSRRGPSTSKRIYALSVLGERLSLIRGASERPSFNGMEVRRWFTFRDDAS